MTSKPPKITVELLPDKQVKAHARELRSTQRAHRIEVVTPKRLSLPQAAALHEDLGAALLKARGAMARMRREAAGHGMKEAARRMDVTPSYVRQVEQGKRNATPEFFERIEAAYDRVKPERKPKAAVKSKAKVPTPVPPPTQENVITEADAAAIKPKPKRVRRPPFQAKPSTPTTTPDTTPDDAPTPSTENA